MLLPGRHNKDVTVTSKPFRITDETELQFTEQQGQRYADVLTDKRTASIHLEVVDQKTGKLLQKISQTDFVNAIAKSKNDDEVNRVTLGRFSGSRAYLRLRVDTDIKEPQIAVNEYITDIQNPMFAMLENKNSEQNKDEHITEYALSQNYPNPFNPTTQIAYQLPEENQVRLEVFDLLGRRVAILVNEHQGPGHHSAVFDASHLASGVYLYRLTAGEFTQTRTFQLIK